MSEEEAAERLQGTVKFFSGRGYGFLLPEGKLDTEEETIFFHISNVEDRETLEADQVVSFELAPGRSGKGQQAVKIKRVEEQEEQEEE